MKSQSNSQELEDLLWPVGPDENRHVKDCAFVRFDEGVCECDKELPEEQAALLQLALSCLPERTNLEDLDPKEKINRVEYARFCSIRNAAIDTIEQNIRRAFS